MKKKQLPIPGLEELIRDGTNADKSRETLEEIFRPLAQIIKSLEDRILKLEIEVNLLRIQVEKGERV